MVFKWRTTGARPTPVVRPIVNSPPDLLVPRSRLRLCKPGKTTYISRTPSCLADYTSCQHNFTSKLHFELNTLKDIEQLNNEYKLRLRHNMYRINKTSITIKQHITESPVSTSKLQHHQSSAVCKLVLTMP